MKAWKRTGHHRGEAARPTVPLKDADSLLNVMKKESRDSQAIYQVGVIANNFGHFHVVQLSSRVHLFVGFLITYHFIFHQLF